MRYLAELSECLNVSPAAATCTWYTVNQVRVEPCSPSYDVTANARAGARWEIQFIMRKSRATGWIEMRNDHKASAAASRSRFRAGLEFVHAACCADGIRPRMLEVVE